MSAASDEQKTNSKGATGRPAGGDPRLDALVHRLPPRLAGTVISKQARGYRSKQQHDQTGCDVRAR